MKVKSFLVVALMSFPFFLLSQPDTLKPKSVNKKDSRHFSISINVPLLPLDLLANGYFDATEDVTGRFGKHIVALSATIGSEFNIFGNGKSYGAIDLMYGREYPMDKKWRVEVYSGLGVIKWAKPYHHPYDGRLALHPDGYTTTTYLGIPLRAKFIHSRHNKFGWGWQTQLNVNAGSTIFSVFAVLQRKFR